MERTRKQNSRVSSDDFRNFLKDLEETGELVKIKRTVSSTFELAAVGSKFEGKQAVLFERVEGSNMSVACNVLGTRNRFCRAIGVDDEKQIHARITSSISKISSPKKLQVKRLFTIINRMI